MAALLTRMARGAGRLLVAALTAGRPTGYPPPWPTDTDRERDLT